ncbi:MAG: type II toxin-antitoxin system VapC family toxin [Parvularculaceae bacterium]
MRILLDTSYLYNLMRAPRTFSEGERLVLSSANAEFFVSAASIWEMTIKFNARRASGERKSEFDPAEVLRALEDENVDFLPITVAHAAARLQTPLGHKDPFDEMLLIQAQEEGLKLLTIDRLLAGHPLTVSP